jgi:hypothetical protein
MRPTGSMGAQIGTLVIASSVVQLTNGFSATFISLLRRSGTLLSSVGP